MKTVRNLLFAVVLLAPAFAALAQPPGPPPHLSPEKKKELRAQKAAYLTSKISLTPEEAQQFWPVYNKFDEETDALRRELGESDHALRDKGDAVTEAEAQAHMDKEIANRQKELDLLKRFQADGKRIIGAKRMVELSRAERDFHREVIKRFQERRDEIREERGLPPRRR